MEGRSRPVSGSRPRVVVLGGGRVGGVVADDLAADFDVTVADRDERLLARCARRSRLQVAQLDLASPGTVEKVVASAAVVVNALPGRLGHRALAEILDARKDVVDISFTPEDPLVLSSVARERGVTALVDFGVAPGMSHVLYGAEASRFATVERYECLVGGLPVSRDSAFQYKAPFHPRDVLEEYTRPARIRRRGGVVTLPALSEEETVSWEGVGTLEAFLTDGLRSLLRRDSVPEMVEKTLRYPGHASAMRVLRDAGLFGEAPVEAAGVLVRPLDVAAALLFPRWTYRAGEPDLTVMRVTVEGTLPSGRPSRARWTLLDRARDGVSSMARTTGYPCAAGVRLLASGGWARPGVHPPETVGGDETAFRFLLEEQARRGVVYRSDRGEA